ncbi:MAG: MAPEG family protein [Pseudomonadota bacterium]
MIETLHGALLTNLFLFALLFAAQVAVRTGTHGLVYSLSSLDAEVESTTLEDRLNRITRNQLEFIVLFGLTAITSNQSSLSIDHENIIALSVIAGRSLYVLMASTGVPVLRSGSWLIAFAAWGYLAMQVAVGAA